MKVGVVYAGKKQIQLRCQVEPGSTVQHAIEHSGILAICPEIDLGRQKVGIYGKFVKLDAELEEGDRVEIYRKITRVLDEDDDDDE